MNKKYLKTAYCVFLIFLMAVNLLFIMDAEFINPLTGRMWILLADIFALILIACHMIGTMRQIKGMYWRYAFIGIGFIVVVALAAYGAWTGVKWPLVAWVAVFVLAVFFINIKWNMGMVQKMNNLSAILKEDPDKYIEEINALLDGMEADRWQQVRCVNLGVAYYYKRDYARAKEWLQQAAPERFAAVQQGVYYSDLALVDFYAGDWDEACQIMESHRDVIGQVMQREEYQDLLADLPIFEKLAEGNIADARKLIAQAREYQTGAYELENLEYLENLCQKLENEE